MLNEERNARRRNLVMFAIMLCLGVLLMVLFVTSCKDSLTPPEVTTPTENIEITEPTTGATEPTTEATEPTTEPTEPSPFEGYTAVFGDNSLQAALTNVPFDTITEHDKEVITTIMGNFGGTAEFTEETITLSLDGQSVVFYADLTTVLIDAEGNAGGTRWIESTLSKLVTPMLEQKLAMCLTKADSFAAKYQVNSADVYTAYCDSMDELGWKIQSNSDMILMASRTVKDIGECTLTVSFADNVVTILVQVTPKNP